MGKYFFPIRWRSDFVFGEGKFLTTAREKGDLLRGLNVADNSFKVDVG